MRTNHAKKICISLDLRRAIQLQDALHEQKEKALTEHKRSMQKIWSTESQDIEKYLTIFERFGSHIVDILSLPQVKVLSLRSHLHTDSTLERVLTLSFSTGKEEMVVVTGMDAEHVTSALIRNGVTLSFTKPVHYSELSAKGKGELDWLSENFSVLQRVIP